MDAPTVRYTRTSDGYDIAYIVEGQGAPLVFMPFHFNHARIRWIVPLYARGLGEHCRVYLYDSRGQGLSSRNIPGAISLDDYSRDLEAVIAANGLTRFTLAAYGGFAHIAIRFAAQYPERVHALILICTSESFTAWPLRSMLPLAEENWDLFLDLTGPKGLSEDLARLWVNFQNASVTKDDYVKLVNAFSGSDVGALLPHLTVPVLLLHSETQHWLSSEEGKKLAARIPNSRLVFLDGHGDAEPDDVQAAKAELEFLRDLPQLESGSPAARGAAAPALSARQREVLHLLAQGRTNREIAEALVLSERTVQRHIADIYDRIGVRNRAEATAFELAQAKQPALLGNFAQ